MICDPLLGEEQGERKKEGVTALQTKNYKVN